MNRDRLSALAHAGHPVASPCSDATVGALIGVLDPPATVLDVGCGSGEWLLRILERFPGGHGVGVDRSPYAIASAREQAQRRLAPGRLRLHQVAVDEFAPDPDGYDLVLCVGSTHLKRRPGAGAGRAAQPHPRPGADRRRLLDPPADGGGARALTAEPEEFLDLEGTLARCRAAGFEVAHAHVSDQGEWDAYEDAWVTALERHERVPHGRARPPRRVLAGLPRDPRLPRPCPTRSGSVRQMPKRFYVSPSQYWRLPEATDLPTLRQEVEQAMSSGATLVLDVEFEGILAELTLIGSRLGQFSLVDIPMPAAEIEDVF